jgi:hypothetical protein
MATDLVRFSPSNQMAGRVESLLLTIALPTREALPSIQGKTCYF